MDKKNVVAGLVSARFSGEAVKARKQSLMFDFEDPVKSPDR